MSIIDKAKALGEAIAASEELANLKKAETEMQQDVEAQAIILEFEELQNKFQLSHVEGKEISEEDRKLAEEVENKMTNNQHIRAYMESQRAFEQILQQINSIIGSAISGGQCGPSSCGPCTSCN